MSTQTATPWQATIIDQLGEVDSDGMTHAVVYIPHDGNDSAPQLIEIVDSESAGVVSAEDYGARADYTDGDVAVTDLPGLYQWHRDHTTQAEEDGDTDEGEELDDHLTTDEEAVDPEDVVVEGEDPESGRLFTIPRTAIELDDTDPTHLKLSFSGSIELDRNNEAQTETFNKLTAGKVTHLKIVAYTKSGPNSVHRRDSDGNIDAIVASKSLVITDILLEN